MLHRRQYISRATFLKNAWPPSGDGNHRDRLVRYAAVSAFCFSVIRFPEKGTLYCRKSRRFESGLIRLKRHKAIVERARFAGTGTTQRAVPHQIVDLNFLRASSFLTNTMLPCVYLSFEVKIVGIVYYDEYGCI